jgi:hypothetical protein
LTLVPMACYDLHMARLPVAITMICLAVVLTACQTAMKEDREPVRIQQPAVPVAEDSPGSDPPRSLPPGSSPGQTLHVSDEAAWRRLIGDWPRHARLVSIEEHRTPVRQILDRFARLSKLNFVLADDVKGVVSGKIEGVPWPRALGAIMHALDLVAVREGNVVRVLTRESWLQESTIE